MTSKRRLAAIMFTDIVGYSAMMNKDEDQALQVVTKNNAIHRRVISSYGGTLLKEMGDGMMAIFDNPTDAVMCAGAIHLNAANADISLRIGIHQGELVVKEGDIFGDGVNIASRIESLAQPGQILISSNVYQNISNKSGIVAETTGPHSIKGFEEPMVLYSVIIDEQLIQNNAIGRPPSSLRNKKSLQFLLYAILSIALIIVGYFIIDNLPATSQEPIDNPPDEIALAVLPLSAYNADNSEQSYFSNGFAIEIINELTKVRSFVVTSFTASRQYDESAQKKISIQGIADTLGVDYIISGSSRLYSGEDSVKLSIELIDPKTHRTVWNETYIESMNDVTRIQSSVARKIAANLDLELSDNEIVALDKVSTSNGEAFRLFLEAKGEFQSLNGPGFLKSIQLLERALELDPDYAQAHTFLAWVYNQSAVPFFQEAINRPFSETQKLFDYHINRAIELDSSKSDLFLVRANYHINHTGLLNNSSQDVEKALELSSWPRIPTNYCICTASTLYVLLKETQKATELVDISSGVDPGSIYVEFEQAMIHMTQGELDKAALMMKKAMKSSPIPFFEFITGLIYYHKEEYETALSYLDRAYNTEGVAIPMAVAYLSNTYSQLGDQTKGLNYKKELIDRQKEGELHLHYILAMVSIAEGKMDEAIELLELSQSLNEASMAYFVNLDPLFSALYDHPGFIEIRSKMQYYE